MFLSTLIQKIGQWQRYRRSVRELAGLTDRELGDIGVSRSDIHRIARRATRA